MVKIWKALADGSVVTINGKAYHLSVIDCGKLKVASGYLAACDPYAGMEPTGRNSTIAKIPPGTYPVKVTLADVSGEGDGSHFREAYASLILGDGEVTQQPLKPISAKLTDDEYLTFEVDTGTACFVDEKAITPGMGDPDDWHDKIFETDEPHWLLRPFTKPGWFSMVDDEKHIREGIANIRLPKTKDGSNIILFHSGWGDGVYHLLGGYDSAGKLVAVHIDFEVLEE